MFTALSSAVSGLDAYQEQMDIIGNNIANLNTTGFKSGTGNLVDSFSNTLQAATSATGNDNSTDPMQIGTGVMTGSVTNDWSEGALNSTGVASNLAINGNGFFVVQDPNNGNAQYLTQDGTFTMNVNGNLVNSAGMQLVGYTSPTLSGTPGAIQINATGIDTSNPLATMTGYTINSQGIITVNMSDGTSWARGQVLLQTVANPQAMTSVGNNLYSNWNNAGPLTVAAAPGSGSLGTIQSGALELSNVDLSAQMADLILAQRAFEANSKMVTTSDEMLETAVNMKR